MKRDYTINFNTRKELHRGYGLFITQLLFRLGITKICLTYFGSKNSFEWESKLENRFNIQAYKDYMEKYPPNEPL